jgi:ATP-binding cassette subfamily B protein
LGADVNIQILEKAVQLELKHFEDSKFYDQLTRARREASVRPVAMVTDTLQLFQNFLTLIGYLFLLVTYSFWMVVGLACSALPAAISEMRFSNIAFRMRNWRSPDTRRLNYVEYVLADDQHVKEVKIFQLGKNLLNRYRELANRFYNEDKKLSISRTQSSFLLSLLATVAFYVCYGVMGFSAATGIMSLGQLTLYVMVFRQVQQAFQSCLTAVGSMYEHNLYMSNLFEFFKIPTNEHKVSLKTSQESALDQEQGIRFENVTFSYPDAKEPALKNINLFIPAGKSLALVGHNGAGKTTFIKMICRLYEPTSGRILIDGRNIQDYSEDELRTRVSVVFQDYNEYQFTLGDNIGFGSINELENKTQIETSAQKGGVTEFVDQMTKGFDTQLGRWFPDGVELSGGQWQKIALARAFMRDSADILIFDEPTASLDPESEQKVFERFRQLCAGKTAILISHRFPTVRMADQIVVIERGVVVEEGSHEDLISKHGRYAELFALQAKGYL